MKKALSHVKYFNDQSIIEILFEEIVKKKKEKMFELQMKLRVLHRWTDSLIKLKPLAKKGGNFEI